MIKPLDKATIRNRAENKLKEYGLCALPVDLFSIVEREDIILYPKNDSTDGVSGMLVRVGDDYCIVYSTYYHNSGFERFSIAHELGHYFLDDHPRINTDGLHKSNAGFISKDYYEQEADIFASGLLMPEDLFRDYQGNYPIGLDGIIGMADLCQTSLTATAIRYVELASKPLIVVLSSNGIINFCVVSEKIRFMKNKEIPQKGWKVPGNTATANLAQNKEDVLNRKRDSKDADLSDWIESERPKDALEEVIGLGRYEKILTVISV
ncbi:MAG: ImmA/IrrE family metallo-endopeptidase [Treponema sp.]|jgi:Zn-dependent peptidase ImmA (M78 family)|nr:ImmA/IrrE family metallo-endopeptidase [Treponema sp.]